jgi:uncharacterized protein YbgA (DUF1722 family)
MLAPVQPNSLFDEVLDFLASTPTPEQIIAFHASEKLQLRAQYLLEQNRAGVLTPAEQSELDSFLEMDYFVTMLKVRAKQKLASS